MTLRIVVTGSECTGKTTLARRLAAHLGAPWLPEAAREYATERLRGGGGLTASDVAPIANRTAAADDAALAGAPPLLVLDTDLISTIVYARHYYGACAQWIEDEARVRRGTHYLLCAPDLPWVADGVRDRPAARATMHALFAAALEEFGASVTVISGRDRAREELAIALADAVADAGAVTGAATTETILR